ncbi:MAG: AAA family ATPase [Chitinispirillia bacterium]|nr:AAA family ATPase [Chitinispirillia bacterium]MCL2267980.1 AAA family ATPase [Chitinispirillia bacterium]
MLGRKMLYRLIDWKNGQNKRALLVKGARQVGKTFIVREFGRAHYKNFIEINFERQPTAKSAFDGDLDARTVILNLSAMGLGPFEAGRTLIFFDEIQSCPRARTAIKFLVEDGRFDYIESGSLLGIGFRDVSSYPVGFEEQVTMYPLDFEEFLWAKGVTPEVVGALREAYVGVRPVDGFLHERMMNVYREYLVVGGMPAAVTAFIENDDFSRTLRVQNSILDSYRDDISKYADREKHLAKKMFDAIPEQLNRKNKRFILADLEKGAAARKYENASMWLTEAGVAMNCFNVAALEAPLRFNEKRNLYKLYMHDTGLLCAQGMRGIQGELLGGNIEVNEGGITENAVGAELAKKGIPLYYYDKKGRSELDFVFAEGGGLSVIEVKSGKNYKTHASLDRACGEATSKLNRCMVLSKYNIEAGANGVIYYPLYMAMFL